MSLHARCLMDATRQSGWTGAAPQRTGGGATTWPPWPGAPMSSPHTTKWAHIQAVAPVVGEVVWLIRGRVAKERKGGAAPPACRHCGRSRGGGRGREGRHGPAGCAGLLAPAARAGPQGRAGAARHPSRDLPGVDGIARPCRLPRRLRAAGPAPSAGWHPCFVPFLNDMTDEELLPAPSAGRHPCLVGARPRGGTARSGRRCGAIATVARQLAPIRPRVGGGGHLHAHRPLAGRHLEIHKHAMPAPAR